MPMRKWTQALSAKNYTSVHLPKCANNAWLLWIHWFSPWPSARRTAVEIADAVYRDGLEPDGSIPYEGGPEGLVRDVKAWWVQAEAVVGFYNAWQLSGQERFAQAAWRSWQYIEDKHIDRVHGDWFKELHHDGTPNPASFKTGPWECPYHHSRACFEMLERLEG